VDIMEAQLKEGWSVMWLSFDSRELGREYAPRQVFYSTPNDSLPVRLGLIEMGCHY
jgi:hypothetical protein